MRLSVALAVALLPAPTAVLAQVAPATPEPSAIEITATRIERFDPRSEETRFGELTFRGGLELRSAHEAFGSLSGVDIGEVGRLVAVTDTGFWLTARPVEADGVLTGLAEIAMAPILGIDGTVDPRKSRSDAEGVRLRREDGRLAAYVAFERLNEVRRFEAGTPDAAALGAAIPTRPALARMSGISANRSIETIALAPPDSEIAGAVVVISERALDARGNIKGWITGAAEGQFSIVRGDGYDITDAAFLGDDLFILERRFSFFGGAMRIRRVWAPTIRPGATVDGPVVIEAGLGQEVDTMEGIAVRRSAAGEALITLVSDDNGSPLQRTLMLNFGWERSLPPLPRPKPAAGEAAPAAL